MSVDQIKCQECAGDTIQFRGTGKNTEHRICSRYTEPGHKTIDEVKAELRRVRAQYYPASRRFA
jgi:hypothetical protein